MDPVPLETPRPTSAKEPPLLVAGLVLCGLLITEAILAWVFLPRAADGLLAGIALEFVTGREAAFPVALAAGAPAYLVAMASVFQNLAVAALVLPLVAKLLERWRTQDHFLARRLRRLEDQAGRHQDFVNRWGPLGVFGFMLVPFLPNGALVSAVIARICGIPARNIITPVVAATLLVAFAWAYAYETLFAVAGRFDDRLPTLIAIALALVAVLWAVLDEWRERARAA